MFVCFEVAYHIHHVVSEDCGCKTRTVITVVLVFFIRRTSVLVSDSVGAANQLVVGWLGGQWYPQPIRVQVRIYFGFISGFLAIHVKCEETFSSTTRHLR